MTLGLIGDEAGAKADEILGRGSYDERLKHYRGQQALTEKTNPILSFGAKVAPALIPGVGLGGMAMRGASLPAKMAIGGLLGGATGGTYGFMEGEGGAGPRLKDARNVGLLSAGLGAAAPAVAAGAGKAWDYMTNASKAKKAVINAAPSVESLKAQAGAKYDAARDLGIKAVPEQTTQLADDIKALVTSEGLVRPDGKIVKVYPKVKSALDMIDAYREAGMDPTQMQQVRRLLQGAAQSADGAEARIGTKMLRQFDDFVEPLAPQFKEANALYAMAKKGELIDQTIELAGIRAGQFSGSGYENALRTEFRALARKIEKGQLKGVTDAEAKAIRKIAAGGKLENIMRDLGKAAPRGIVGTGMSAGVPFMIGNAIGGPALGGAASAASMGIGEVGRRVATAMQSKNALAASALARSGGAMPLIAPPQTNGLLSLLLGAAPAGGKLMSPLIAQ
jgi:hypothetical protein